MWQQYTGVPPPPWPTWRQPRPVARDGTESNTDLTAGETLRRSMPLWSITGIDGSGSSSSMSSSEIGMDEKIRLTPPGNGYLT